MKLLKLFLLVAIIAAVGCRSTHHAASGMALSGENSKNIEKKYALLLEVNAEKITNKSLYSFIDDWYGVPYQYAGKTKNGVDCSGFTTILLKEIYGKQLSGSSLSIYKQCTPIPKGHLQEGDLVFFKIDSKEISHVGIYLQNNKFVHATTKAGVKINDLDEEYYKKYFWGGGNL